MGHHPPYSTAPLTPHTRCGGGGFMGHHPPSPTAPLTSCTRAVSRLAGFARNTLSHNPLNSSHTAGGCALYNMLRVRFLQGRAHACHSPLRDTVAQDGVPLLESEVQGGVPPPSAQGGVLLLPAGRGSRTQHVEWRSPLSEPLQGYLAPKKTHTPLGPPWYPRYRPTVGS